MRVFVLCKAHCMNKDALEDRYGRLYHLYKGLPAADKVIFYSSYRFDSAKTIKQNQLRFYCSGIVNLAT